MWSIRSLFCDNLRKKCFIIGYLTLIAAIIDLVSYIVVAAVASDGFRCDSRVENLKKINWDALIPILVLVNIGTAGFYPYPDIVNIPSTDSSSPSSPPRCYPGMVHMYLMDLLIIQINIFWLQVVSSYVTAVHKKDPQGMRTFVRMSTLKLFVQLLIMFFTRNYSSIMFTNISLEIFFLFTVSLYMLFLNAEKKAQVVEKPSPQNESSIEEVKIAPSKQEVEDQVSVTITDSEEGKRVIVNGEIYHITKLVS